MEATKLSHPTYALPDRPVQLGEPLLVHTYIRTPEAKIRQSRVLRHDVSSAFRASVRRWLRSVAACT